MEHVAILTSSVCLSVQVRGYGETDRLWSKSSQTSLNIIGSAPSARLQNWFQSCAAYLFSATLYCVHTRKVTNQSVNTVYMQNNHSSKSDIECRGWKNVLIASLSLAIGLTAAHFHVV